MICGHLLRSPSISIKYLNDRPHLLSTFLLLSLISESFSLIFDAHFLFFCLIPRSAPHLFPGSEEFSAGAFKYDVVNSYS